MATIQTLVLIGASYLIGSIPFSFLIARLHGVDLRTVGSGNIGGANVWRSCGFGAFLLAATLDIFKGALMPWVAIHLLSLAPPAVVLIGFAAVLGHTYPIFMGFKGGKAVATSGGVLLAITPLMVPLGILVWALAFAISRISSVGSLSAAAAIWLAALIQLTRGAMPFSYAVFITVGAIFVFVLHRENIRRLLQGQERRFGRLF